MAIIWVLLRHANDFFKLEGVLGGFYPYFFIVARSGYLGVDIFFVLSGFLITGLFLDDLQAHIRIKRFYLRRFFKIIPQYWAVVLFGGIITTVFYPEDIDAHSVFSNILFIQNYTGLMPILTHTWSIAIEEHFYLAYPWLLYVICRLRTTATERRQLLVQVIWALGIIVFIARYFSFSPGRPELLSMTHLRVDALLIGCLLRLCEESISVRWARKPWRIVLFFAGSALLVSAILDTNLYSWWPYTATYLATACIISAALNGNPVILKLLENNIMRKIGRVSYGVYLWHLPVICVLMLIVPNVAAGVTVLLYLFLSLAVGAVSSTTLEKYFLDLRKRLVP